MGCHTWVFRKLKTKEDIVKLINHCINNANDLKGLYNPDENLSRSEEELNCYWYMVKHGEFEHTPEAEFIVLSDGTWAYRDELTYDIIIKSLDDAINMCKNAINTLTTFEELKQFVLDNRSKEHFIFSDSYYGEEGESYEEYMNNDRWNIISILDNDIYVNSNRIENELWEGKTYFRVYGYPENEPVPCTSMPDNIFSSSGWTSAQDLINFLEWYKTTKSGKSAKPYVATCGETEYGEELYTAVCEFFDGHNDGDIMVHFG